jgi:type IV pilus assembly protein PilB
MGVARYNLAASLSLLLAQRLLRRLCEHCKEAEQLPENVLSSQGFEPTSGPDHPLYRAVGCDRCHRGYRGRVGIYEVVPVSAELSRRIMDPGGSSEGSLLPTIADNVSLRQAALNKVSAGVTSLEEANRLT